ncbi:MAG TPA: glycosyltransferase 87 family protein [Anaerolineales bacterium]|nr:glycosyltransferase 87 family protein [Anaerolineales bacterium]
MNKNDQARKTPVFWHRLPIVLGALFFAVAFFSLNHGDLPVTCAVSDGILHGHLFDLYDYAIDYLDPAQIAYFPSTYTLFAIWNIPLMLLNGNTPYFSPENNSIWGFGAGIYWAKLLPVVFYFLSAKIFCDILELLGIEKDKRKLAVIFWITVPLSFFSQFIFGQYDSFYVFFMLLGLKHLLRGDFFRGSIFFGISFTFKYFPIFVFIPVVLYLYRKDLKKLINSGLIAGIPLVVELLVFVRSAGFKLTIIQGPVGLISNGINLLRDGIFNGRAVASFFLVFMLLTALWAYFSKEPFSRKRLVEFAVISVSLFALFIPWNPQWILFSSSMLVFLPFMAKDFKENLRNYLILDVLLMFFYSGYVSTYFPWNVDINMFNIMPLFRGINPVVEGETLNLAYLFQLGNRLSLEIASSLYYSGFFAVWLFILIYYFKDNWSAPDLPQVAEASETYRRGMRHIWIRFICAASIYLIPAFVMYFAGQGLLH